MRENLIKKIRKPLILLETKNDQIRERKIFIKNYVFQTKCLDAFRKLRLTAH